LKIFCLYFSAFLFFFACSSKDTNSVVEPYELTKDDTSPPKNPDQMLAALDRVAPPGTVKGEAVKDVRLMIEAQDWAQALRIASGSFAERAFNGWLTQLVQTRKLKLSSDELARLVLTETSAGENAIFLQREKLSNPTVLAKYLEKKFPSFVVSSTVSEKVMNDDTAKSLPDYWTSPSSSDPLYESRAKEYCALSPDKKTSASTELNSFSEGLNSYWHALVLECTGVEFLDGSASKFEEAGNILITKLARSTAA